MCGWKVTKEKAANGQRAIIGNVRAKATIGLTGITPTTASGWPLVGCGWGHLAPVMPGLRGIEAWAVFGVEATGDVRIVQGVDGQPDTGWMAAGFTDIGDRWVLIRVMFG